MYIQDLPDLSDFKYDIGGLDLVAASHKDYEGVHNNDRNYYSRH